MVRKVVRRYQEWWFRKWLRARVPHPLSTKPFLPSVASYAGSSPEMRAYMAGEITATEYFERSKRRIQERKEGN